MNHKQSYNLYAGERSGQIHTRTYPAIIQMLEAIAAATEESKTAVIDHLIIDRYEELFETQEWTFNMTTEEIEEAATAVK